MNVLHWVLCVKGVTNKTATGILVDKCFLPFYSCLVW